MLKEIGVMPFVFANTVMAANSKLGEQTSIKDNIRFSSGFGLTWFAKYFTLEAFYSLHTKCKAGEQTSQFQLSLGFD